MASIDKKINVLKEDAIALTRATENFPNQLLDSIYIFLCKNKYINNPSLSFDNFEKSTNDENLNSIFSMFSVEDLKSFFIEILYKYTNVSNSKLSTTLSLDQLTYFLLDLDKTEDNRILDSNSFLGSFLSLVLSFNQKKLKEQQISVHDLNPSNVKLLKIISDIFNNGSTNVEIQNDDFLFSYIKHFNKARIFNFGQCHYLDKNIFEKPIFEDVAVKDIAGSEWLYIDKALKSKLDSFKIVALVCGSALWSHNAQLYRRHLIENGYLEGIIELPNKALSNTSIKLYLIILSSENKGTKFLDATPFVIKNTSRFSARETAVTLDVGRILDQYHACKTISLEEVLSLKSLIPSNVNMKIEKIKNGVPLNELAQIFVGSQYTLKNFEGMVSEAKTGTSILKSNDINDFVIDLDSVTHINYKDTKLFKYCIQKGDVIISSKSSKIKIGVVDFEPDENIIVTGGMLVVRPDKSKLDPYYLKMFLDSKLGQQSLKTIQKGSVIVTINLSDFSEIEVPYIKLEDQRKLAFDYLTKLSTLLALKSELKKAEDDLDSIFEESEAY